MIARLSWFVPFDAYLIQVALAMAGMGLLTMTRSNGPLWLRLGTAFPIGFALVGACQVTAFVLSAGSCGHLLIKILLCVLVPVGIWDTSSRLRRSSASFLALVVFGVIVIGFIVSQSAPLGESDPRFQIAYRAKILATQNSFADGPYWSDPRVFHVNPKYPLLFSGGESVTLNLIGDPGRTTALRATSFGFFVSFLILFAGYTARLGNACALIALAILLSVPRIWALAIDEVYADFPLGVYILSVVVWARYNRAVLPVILFGFAIAGTKSEGIVIGALMVPVLFLLGDDRKRRVLLGSAFMFGLICGWMMFKLGVRQISPDMPMENVQLQDIKLDRIVQGLDRLPTIVIGILKGLLDPKSFGLFFPMCFLLVVAFGNRMDRLLVAFAFCYFVILTIPFLITQLPLSYHLSSTVARFGFQVLPVLCLPVVDCLERIRGRLETSDEPIIADRRIST